MKGLLIAIQFLTRLPTPRIAVSSEEFAASMRWFPAVGLIVGALVAGAGWAGSAIDPWTGALCALLIWVAATGALHLDGLGDLADASGAAHKDRARLLAVLSDPHVGSFAIVAIALQLMTKLVLLRALIDGEALVAIALVPFAARIGPLIWSRALPDLHAGLGSRFRNVVRPIDFAIWSALLLAAAWISPSLLTAPLIFAFWGWWLMRKIGGISGDGHGAGIEVGESFLVAAALLVVHLA
ncbi:adenosylcobinamide-GDP ribazoletransferase [Sphingopyxis sp. L1A2A]|uniref:adenosylcobinamide-GDP ribazoletransferase n=1 Tax=Sphingopyxis sp. L1A2A TaxID=2502247 RepID=UPI0010F4ADE6|nr:adenosylcobinamide-GDP ribazoletransferase [Sphingopyxis sp. L1A2A]